MRPIYTLCVAAAATLFAASTSRAVVTYDLTTAGTSATINQALYVPYAQQPTGSGVYQSFVRIGANTSTVQGYNTDAASQNFQFDEKAGNFTHSLLLSSLKPINNPVTGVSSYLFTLDINQTASSPLLSLNRVVILQESSGALTNLTLGNNPTFGTAGHKLVYDMDSLPQTDNTVNLNYNLSPVNGVHGSGSGADDMFLYVPVSLFDAAKGPYVYLYSLFGDPNVENDGYEEWAALQGTFVPVPLPGAVWAGLVLMGGYGLSRKLRRNKDIAA